MKKLVFCIGLLMAVFATQMSVQGQVTGGAVTGTVTDPNGAVIPNAQVSITDKARGITFTANTTDSGSYQFPNVPAGAYTITITGTGFNTVNQELIISLNQTATVDVVLQIAGATAVVDVATGGEAIVQSDTSQLSRTFDTRKVLDLPIFGNQNALATLAPNVIPPASGTAGSGGVSGGIRARGNTFNIDGIDNNAISVTGPASGVIQDAVQEFTLLQNNFSAEFGAGAGGQFNTITKSGTNDLRGSAFVYYDRDQYRARTTTEDNRPRSSLRESRFGGTLGGPLPFFNFGENDGPLFKSGKNRMFFFGAFERIFNQAGGTAAGTALVPTAAGLNQLLAAGASPFIINLFRNSVVLPANAEVFSGSTLIPASQTLGVSGVPFGRVALQIPSTFEQNSYQANVDHLPNQDNQFRYRYSRRRFLSEQAGNGGFAFNNSQAFDSDLFSFNYIKSFTSSLINDLRLSYLGTRNNLPLANPEFANFPNITVNALNLLIGPRSNLPQSGIVDSYQVYDSITWIRGAHNFKFGGDYRRNISSSNFLPRARGDYSYASFSELLLDLRPTTVNIRGIGSGGFVANNHRFFTFAQDDWKVTPNLTLNLGVRYEYQGLFRDEALQATASNANVPGVIEFGVPKTDRNNIAPRIGFAYSPTFGGFIGRTLFGDRGQSSIRANYGRSFFANFTNFSSISLPPTLQGELQNSGPATNFLASGGAGTAPFIPNTTPAFLRANAGSLILDQTVPYADSFTVSYQREIARSTGLELRYLYTRGRDLPVQVQLNSRTVVDAAFVIPTLLTTPTAAQLQALPTIGAVVAANPTISPTTFVAPRQLGAQGFAGALTAFSPIGKSDYHGFSASLNRRFTKSFGFTAAYTLSKTRDNSTNELFTSLLNPRRAQDAGEFFGSGLNLDDEYSDSVLDIPHRFVSSFNYDFNYFDDSKNFLLRTILGGFQINGIFQAQVGQPITVLSGIDSNRNGDSAGDRAIFNPNGDPTTASGVMGAIINAAGQVQLVPITGTPNPNVRAYVATNPNAGFIQTGYFASALVGGDSNLRTTERNSFRTNGFHRTDMVILKNNRFGKDNRFNVQLGAEIFDVFNQRVRTIAGVGAFSSAFNTAGNPSFNNYEIGNATGRIVTLRGKFIF